MDVPERSDNFPVRLRDRCRDLAEKYGYDRTDVGRGFESFAAHLFSQESGFQEILEDQDDGDPDLSEVIMRYNDLGVDVVLEDSESRQLLIVQTKWLGKNTKYPLADLEAFFDLHDKLCEPGYIATGGDMARELLGCWPLPLIWGLAGGSWRRPQFLCHGQLGCVVARSAGGCWPLAW